MVEQGGGGGEGGERERRDVLNRGGMSYDEIAGVRSYWFPNSTLLSVGSGTVCGCTPM